MNRREESFTVDLLQGSQKSAGDGIWASRRGDSRMYGKQRHKRKENHEAIIGASINKDGLNWPLINMSRQGQIGLQLAVLREARACHCQFVRVTAEFAKPTTLLVVVTEFVVLPARILKTKQVVQIRRPFGGYNKLLQISSSPDQE